MAFTPALGKRADVVTKYFRIAVPSRFHLVAKLGLGVRPNVLPHWSGGGGGGGFVRPTATQAERTSFAVSQ